MILIIYIINLYNTDKLVKDYVGDKFIYKSSFISNIWFIILKLEDWNGVAIFN